MSPSAPFNREQRLKCYGFRDAYLQCVQEHSEQAIGKDKDNHTIFISPEPCKDFLQLMNANCPQSWVLHFQLQWGNEHILKNLKNNANKK